MAKHWVNKIHWKDLACYHCGETGCGHKPYVWDHFETDVNDYIPSLDDDYLLGVVAQWHVDNKWSQNLAEARRELAARQTTIVDIS